MVWLAATVFGGGALAQSVGDAPKPIGFPAGPLVIAPSLTTGLEYNSNLFLNAQDASPSADQVLTIEPALQLTVPFSNSTFRFGDTLTWVDYKKTPQTSGRTSNDAAAELNLRFASFDVLDLATRRITGVAETIAFDPGGEVKFDGKPYTLHTESVSLSREVQGVRGYRLSLTRNALAFVPSATVNFFNYSGFDGEAAFVQPLSSNARLSFGYLGSRYDHFELNAPDPYAVFRTESGDTAYVQLDGQLGTKQPYSARVGWEQLNFTGNSAKDYSGIVGLAKMSVIVGGGTSITVNGQQQPYRSFFGNNNFYVFDQIGVNVDRHFPRGSSIGGNASISRSTYGESVEQPDGAFVYRHDRTVYFEAYGNLAVSERVIFRLSISKNRKYTNFQGADYNAFVVFGGFVLGWI